MKWHLALVHVQYTKIRHHSILLHWIGLNWAPFLVYYLHHVLGNCACSSILSSILAAHVEVCNLKCKKLLGQVEVSIVLRTERLCCGNFKGCKGWRCHYCYCFRVLSYSKTAVQYSCSGRTQVARRFVAVLFFFFCVWLLLFFQYYVPYVLQVCSYCTFKWRAVWPPLLR